LKWWYAHLLPVLDEFVLLSKHLCEDTPLLEANRNFWTHLYRWNSGSGSPCVTGWFNVFFPYVCGPRGFTRNRYLDWDHKERYVENRCQLTELEKRLVDPSAEVLERRSAKDCPETSVDQSLFLEIVSVTRDPSIEPSEEWKSPLNDAVCACEYGGRGPLYEALQKYGKVCLRKSYGGVADGYDLRFADGASCEKALADQQPLLDIFASLGADVLVIPGVIIRIRQLRAQIQAYEQRTQEPGFCGNTPGTFPPGHTSAGFVWEHGGTEIPAQYVGGFLGVEQDVQTGALRPVIGWAVSKAQDEGEGEQEDKDE